MVLGLTPEGLDACFDSAAEGEAAITLKPLMLLFQNIDSLLDEGPPQHVWEDLRAAAEMVFRCGIALFCFVSDMVSIARLGYELPVGSREDIMNASMQRVTPVGH